MSFAKFQNTSEFTLGIDGQSIDPDQTATLDISNPEVLEEIQTHIGFGELVFVPEEGVEFPTGITGQTPQGPRRWTAKTDGGRAYLYFSTTLDRGRHSLYPTYWHWSSAYDQNNPSRDAHGESVVEPAKLVSLTMPLRGVDSERTPYTVTLWKQTKSRDSNDVTNAKIFTRDLVLDGTTNTTHTWTESDFENNTLGVDDVVFMTYRRTNSGTSRFAYVKHLLFEFESLN